MSRLTSRLPVAFLALSLLAGSGCQSLQSSSDNPYAQPRENLLTRSWHKLTQRKDSQPAYQEPMLTQVPDKLRDPARLSSSYASLMEQTGNYEEARLHYERVLEDQPKDITALVGLARVEQQLGRNGIAERHLQTALKLQPDSALALHGLGRLQSAQGQWTSAAETLNRAVIANPDDTRSRYDLAVALTHTGQIDGALPHFIRTVGEAEAHYNVALILEQQGRDFESQQQLQIALSLQPDFAAARQHLQLVEGRLTGAMPAAGSIQRVSAQAGQQQVTPPGP